ncbi:MAG: hypothetical protein HKN16_02080 [Saprospiraceae bacterium]|nr:hypothetical protein [Saprospiraceae bacterium]
MKTIKRSLLLLCFSLVFAGLQANNGTPADPPHDDHGHKYRSQDRGFEFFVSEVFDYNFSFKIGGGSFYSIANISSNRVWPWRYNRSSPQWALGLGVGSKGRLLGIPVRTEVSVNHINEEEFIDLQINAYSQARFMVDIPIGCGGISLGPTYNLHVSEIEDPDTGVLTGSGFLPDWQNSESNDDLGIFHWAGFTIGVVF